MYRRHCPVINMDHKIYTINGKSKWGSEAKKRNNCSEWGTLGTG
jgi:hypothetical protein